MCEHPWFMVARGQTNYLLTRGRQLWHTICGKRACRSLNKLSERKIQTYRRLGRRLVLRHIAPVGFCIANTRYFYAGIYQKTIIEIRAHHSMSATLPVLTGAEKIRHRSTIPPHRERNCTGAEICGQYPLLCAGGRYDGVNGFKYHCK